MADVFWGAEIKDPDASNDRAKIGEELGLCRVYDGTGFAKYYPYIYGSNGFEQYIPYVHDGTGWKRCK